MSKAEEIAARLQTAFPDGTITVKDVSEAHRGHAGYTEGGESHFDVSLQHASFSGMSRIAQHRAVHAAIGADLMGRIHALSLDLKA
ncbi:MAG: BolA family protein [Pseudomonadota bacterium]